MSIFRRFCRHTNKVFLAAHEGWGNWTAFRCQGCGDIRVTRWWYVGWSRFERW